MDWYLHWDVIKWNKEKKPKNPWTTKTTQGTSQFCWALSTELQYSSGEYRFLKAPLVCNIMGTLTSILKNTRYFQYCDKNTANRSSLEIVNAFFQISLVYCSTVGTTRNSLVHPKDRIICNLIWKHFSCLNTRIIPMQVWHLRHVTYLPLKCVHFCALMCSPSVDALPLTVPPPTHLRSGCWKDYWLSEPRAFSSDHFFVL